MANVFAVKSGNWSDTTVWNTGALPTAADDVFANNFVVNVDTNTTVLSIRNTSATGIAAGGRFELRDGVTLTCTNSTQGVVQTTAAVCAVFSQASPATTTLNAILRNGTTTNGSASVSITGTGTFSLVGGIQTTLGGSASPAIAVSAPCNINIIGDIRSGNSFNASGISLSAAAIGTTINITGDLIAGVSNGNGAYCVSAAASVTINVTGNCYWQAVTGNNFASGCLSVTSGTYTITGNITGSNFASQSATVTIGGGTLTVIGSIFGGLSGIAVSGSSVFVTGPLESSTNGTQPLLSGFWRWHTNLVPTYYAVRNRANTAYRNLYTSDYTPSQFGLPTATNVRSGTIYGPTNEYTGTCAVPAAGSVALGVAVDNTTGTAVLTADAARTALGLASANLDAQFAAIPAAPSAATIRAEIDANSTKLDATVSSRLASSSYSAPLDAAGTRSAVGLSTGNLDTQLSGISSGISGLPSASAIASAVWAAATRTLTTAIDNSATIAAAVWGYATGRTITGGTVDTLTNAPSVPSAATIASQVRTELSTELSRIDVATSTRLAPSGTLARVTLTDTVTTLTNAPTVPTPSQIASQVRVEITPELNRMSNAATTQEVADIVEGAVDG